ncbi:PREDICTED: granzyme A [Chinchilla lanigera]|uniref:Granzyme A n=1 Tax=Chinchilla lanigera TaxID=34839 RepID=A0A8C2V2Z8_CHILA|nr:PREDICTED: granzyme A [Chinchilla lanigera]
MRNSYALLASSLSIVIFLLLIPEDACVRIIGGHEVTPHSRPYMVLLKFDQTKICAGALIAQNWVLTAAHCDLKKKAQVILGAHSITANEPEKQIISVKKEFPHPCFDLDTGENDLKLLQLNKMAKINKNVAILQLPNNGDDVKPGTICHVAGWGMTSNNSPLSDVLREVNVTTIDRKICNNAEHYNFNPVIGLNMICAGSPRGGKDSCHGDSGSPLRCGGVFRGITSFGHPGKCGVPQAPGVYTRLSKKYIHWIDKVMKETV